MRSHSSTELSHSPILFLINPAAGGGSGITVSQRIKSILAEDFPENQKQCSIAFTRPEETLDQARKACEDYSTIIAVGGDGTASWILQGLFPNSDRVRFGLIPLGTGNDLARSLGIYDPHMARSQKSLRKALHNLLYGMDRPMDIFEIQGVGCFSNYAGIGLDARVLSDYNGMKHTSWFRFIQWSRGLKFLCYGILLLKHLGYKLPQGMELSVQNGDTRRTLTLDKAVSSVIVSNTRTYAGGFVLNPGSSMDDGRIEVTLVRGITDMVRILLARFAPFRKLTAGLCQEQAEKLHWSSPPGLPYEWDGELAPDPLPQEGTMSFAGRIQVILPPNS